MQRKLAIGLAGIVLVVGSSFALACDDDTIGEDIDQGLATVEEVGEDVATEVDEEIDDITDDETPEATSTPNETGGVGDTPPSP